MCGIAGIVSRFQSNQENLHRVNLMTNVIQYRGPDAEGNWSSKDFQVVLGHRRLSIIDLTTSGSQPMRYNERYTIIFNGEIYNYVELRQFLIFNGYSFKTKTDTEVLIALYDFEKEECLNRLDGMFAFVIYDQIENKLFCARDRFGEKPFHYFFNKQKEFVFASEIKSIWAAGIPKVVNEKLLYNYLKFQTITNPENLSETFYSNIFRLEHSHYLTLELSTFNINIVKYYNIDLDKIDYDISFDAAKIRFKELFNSSLQKRLRSDVPIGCSLSGGLDSSLIVCSINEYFNNLGNKPITFSAQFPGFEKNEAYFQNLVIERTNSESHIVFPNEMDLSSQIDEVFNHQEEPFGSSSILVQNEVYRLAKQKNVTVLLDGQGADEILAGYHYYFPYFFRELKSNRVNYNKQFNEYVNLLGKNSFNSPSKRNMLIEYLKFKFPQKFNLIRSLKFKYSHRDFLSDEFHETYKKSTYYFKGNNNTLNEILKYNCVGGGLQELLRYADRNSMAQSREVRLPFLNHELVNFLFTLPSTFKINNGWTKFIMREAFVDSLPKEICWRKDKIGFEPPQDKWLLNKDVNENIRENIIRITDLGYFDKKIKFSEIESKVNKWSVLMAGKLLQKLE